MTRLPRLLAACLPVPLLLLPSCGGSPAAHATTPSVTAAPPPTPSPAQQVGPGSLTLDQEIGAVMMVGFQGPPTDSVLANFRQHQFGGLLVVNLNSNASSASTLSSMIASLRATSHHRLIAATDQEGGGVCIDIATVPCLPMPVDRAGTARMATALRGLGFDLDLGPVSDVCSGSSSIMWGRCYGTEPASVGPAVASVVDGIHAAHMLAAAKHFPGHGDTSVSSETQLPRIDESLDAIRARGLPPFRADVAHDVDFVLLGHLFYPALDPHRSADLSPATIQLLRNDVGFRGAIISDDMEMGAITSSTPAPEAAVEFLIAGGDMVMIAHHLAVADATYDAIRAAVESGRLSRQRLDDAVATLEAIPAT